MKHLDENSIKKIISDYTESKKSIKQIAKEINCCEKTVRVHLTLSNNRVRNPKKLSKELLFEDYINNNLSCREIGDKYDCSHNTILKMLHNYDIKVRSTSRKGRKNIKCSNSAEIKIKKGDQFGLLKVIEWTESTGWWCECQCGSSLNITSNDLIKERKKSCGCLKGKATAGFQEIPGNFIAKFKRGADYRGIKFNINAEIVYNLYIKQNKKCAISGVPLYFSNKKSKTTASIDRIDSNKNYDIENIQLLHKTVNIIKWSLPQNEFIEWCKTISEFQSTVKQNS